MKEILSKYPSACAVYDIGKYYGVSNGEDFYLLDKQSLEIEKALLRYEKEVIELIESAIPIWFAEDPD